MTGSRLNDKLACLRRLLADTDGVAVAFSGGVDSTFLAAVAHEVLGARALAVTALSPTYPQREQDEAAALAARLGIAHETIVSNELEIAGFAQNAADRCYYCKSELFQQVKQAAARRGLKLVADGSNVDDAGDYRPGRRAACEQGVLSPLQEAGMTKADIRALSKDMDLPTATKPALACLASRFPYGDRITPEKLHAVDDAEMVLRREGFEQVRVRHHGSIARIEVEADMIPRFLDSDRRARIVAGVRAAGFTYVSLDLAGYRTGSMNETLPPAVRSAEQQA